MLTLITKKRETKSTARSNLSIDSSIADITTTRLKMNNENHSMIGKN